MSDQLVKRLRELSNAVTRADWNEFSMRIPVEKDRDADFVLLQAADKIAALEKDAARWCKLLSCCENDHEIREHIEDAVDVIAFQHQVDFRTLDSMTPTEKIDAAIQFDAAMKGGA